MEINDLDLESLFINDPSLAIEYCQVIISTTSKFETFTNFYNYHLNNSRVSICTKQWGRYTISIKCKECMNEPNSCICLECFLNGNHEGHDYTISPHSTGNCDCGDLSQWKRSGFCSKHHGLEDNSHPENYINEELRTLLTDKIFKASFTAIKHLPNDACSTLSIILEFLNSFIKLGDGFRRLLVISLTEKINFYDFLDDILYKDFEFNEHLIYFIGNLINDQVFKVNFAEVNFNMNLGKILPLSFAFLEGTRFSEILSIIKWGNLIYNCYSKQTIQFLIEKRDWNWVTFSLTLLNYTKELFSIKKNPFSQTAAVPSAICHIHNLKPATEIQPNKPTQDFFDLIFTRILSSGTVKGKMRNVNDTIIVSSFNPNDKKIEMIKFIRIFDRFFFDVFDFFKMKKNLKFDTMFDELDKTFDISPIYLIGKNSIGNNENQNENDNFVFYLLKNKNNLENLRIIDYHYKSFPNGASFFMTHPMYHSLAYLLRNDDICRIKIARFLSMKNFQSLRIRLGIATLKNIIAIICSYQSLVPKNNVKLFKYVSLCYINNNFVSTKIPLFLPLMQLLVGIRCDDQYYGMNEFSLKEFFAFEMAREIGLFDDHIDNDKSDFDSIKKQMIFTFFYLSLLIVIDRTLFNFDGYKFAREQIIFQLKKGVSNLNELNNLFDATVFDSRSMNKIISDVAIARQKKSSSDNESDYSFHLKEGIEVNLISAINSIHDGKVLMNNEISKHPDTLLKIQSFEPEETYFFNHNKNEEEEEVNEDEKLPFVCLKEFLITPTVLAFIYKTLRNDSESNKTDLNDHLAMNILVLISKFILEDDLEDDKNAKFDETTVIQYDSTVVDLISQLRKVVFNHKRFMNKNAMIKNTMSIRGFNSFLNMKIYSNEEKPKSLFEILLEKGEIGKNVLSQMTVTIIGSDDEELKQNIDKMKKIRAQKLKENILNQYKTATKNFNVEDDGIQKNEEEEEDICSICSNKRKNEVLFYPLYIYRTKFPFIIDKPPLVIMTKRISLKEAEITQDEDILQSVDYTDLDDEEEEKIPDVDDIFAQLLDQSPDLVITNDLDEEEAQIRRIIINSLHDDAMQKHQELIQQKNEKMRNKIQQKKLELQKKKEELIRKESELENPDLIVTKRCTPGNLFVIQFGICQHLVHHDCVNGDEFLCPIDRSYKNGLLPNIDNLPKSVIFDSISNTNCEVNSENLSNELKEALTLFINKYSLFFKSSDDKIVDVFVELVKSISGLIETYEVRLRSLPDCLDSKKTIILSRNLFLTAWYAYRMNGKPVMKTGFKMEVSENVDSKLTVFQRFIKKLIECDEIEENVSKKNQSLNQILSSFIDKSSLLDFHSKRGEKEFCLFLRRVCLADHFLLKNNENESELIDWDEILSSYNLSQKFNVSFKTIDVSSGDDFEFKPFVFSKMPKEFLRFAQKPYGFPVEQTDRRVFFNILNYNKMITCYDDLNEDDSSDIVSVDYLGELVEAEIDKEKSCFRSNFSKKNYPSVVLFICDKASSVAVIDGKRMKYLKPFYLDKYGCTDIGFQRNQPLFLNENRFDRVMDQILSGDFSNNLDTF